MKALAAYLWKEWRDQRAGLIGFAFAVPLLLAVAMATIPGQWRSADVLPTCVAFAGFFIAMLTVVSDVVPGEERRGRFGFLARLPQDLRGAFVAKLLFVVGALAFCGVYAWFCATTLSAAIGGGSWLVPFDATLRWTRVTSFQTSFLHTSLLLPSLALAAWVFAVSCWLPRGTLALPAALVALAAIGGPVAVLALAYPRLLFGPREIDALSTWLPASALVAAAFAFLRGARHGRRPRRIVTWALLGMLFAAAPVWAWSAKRGYLYVSFDLANDAFKLQPVALGDGGRFVFANVQPQTDSGERSLEERAIHAAVLDLADGSLRAVGGPDDFFELPNHRPLAVGTVPFVLLGHATDAYSTQRLSWGPIEWIDGFDGRSGTQLDSSRWRSLLQDGGALSDAIARARDFLVMPDGARCWLTDRTLHVEARDGTTRTTAIRERGGNPDWRPRGAGFVAWNGVVDVASGRYFSTSPMRSVMRQDRDGVAVDCCEEVVAIRADGWLVRIAERVPRRFETARAATYVLRNTDGTRERPANGITDRDCIETAFSDGRVLVGPAAELQWAHPSELALLDPESGARIPIALPEGVATPEAMAYIAALPSGAAVCLLEWKGRESRFPARTRVVRIDGGGGAHVTAELPISSVLDVVGCPDESTVVVATEDRRILRAKFDGSPFEVAFPRSSRLIRDERDTPSVGAPK